MHAVDGPPAAPPLSFCGRGGSSCPLGRVHELQAHGGRTAAHFAPQDGRIRHPESGRRVGHFEKAHLNALGWGQSHGWHCLSFISACRVLFASQLKIAVLFMWARLVVDYIMCLAMGIQAELGMLIPVPWATEL